MHKKSMDHHSPSIPFPFLTDSCAWLRSKLFITLVEMGAHAAANASQELKILGGTSGGFVWWVFFFSSGKGKGTSTGIKGSVVERNIDGSTRHFLP
jgi:hypothetical protein